MSTRTVTIAWSILSIVAVGAAARADDGKRPPAPRRIAISVTEKGFDPSGIQVHKGEEVTLVFTRKTNRTCAKEVLVHLDDHQTVDRKLPLDTPVEITATFPKAGELEYACAMSMHGGVITVQ